ARGQCAQTEIGDLGGIACFDVQLADSGYLVAAPLEEDCEVKRVTLETVEKVETAGHAAELHRFVHRLAGIIFMEISVQLSAVAAVEGFEPSFEGVAGGSFWNRRGRG